MRGLARGVAPDRVNRVVCHCRFCGSYAQLLGRADQILDPRGGTDVFQMSPGLFEIRRGLEHVRCVRLTRRGALRWYASCCDTPFVNTLASMRVPFMALVHSCIDRSALEAPLDQVRGPILARVNGQFQKEQAFALAATRWALVRMLSRYVWLLTKWWWRGDHRRCPLFDDASGAPIREPRLAVDNIGL